MCLRTKILHADDKELNGWVSVKNLSKYHDKSTEKEDFNRYKRRARNKVP